MSFYKSQHRKVTRFIKTRRMPAVLLSTAYFPSIAYLFRIMQAEQIVMEAHEHYSRQTARNRCMIAGPNGLQKLSVPVLHPEAQDKEIRSIRIDHRLNWMAIHWRSFEAAYNRSPFFLHYRDKLEALLRKRHTFLWDMNLEILQTLLSMLKMKQELSFTASYAAEMPAHVDLRLKGKKDMTEYGLELSPYPQVFDPAHGFIPGLSVIDLLFNRGPESVSYLKSVRT